MRALKIEAVSVETAGQSCEGSLVKLTGIVDGRAFRDAVLRQRDAIVSKEIEASVGDLASVPQRSSDSREVLEEIRDALLRIENSITCGRQKP